MLASRRPAEMSVKMSERLREQIEEQIATGRLAPGSALDELALAAQYGVSRTPVREALIQLAAGGLVDPAAARAPWWPASGRHGCSRCSRSWPNSRRCARGWRRAA